MNGILKSWTLTNRQLCDCELILNKSFDPIDGFMTQVEYDSVLTKMKLPDGNIFPLPITLDVDKKFSEKISLKEKIVLRQKEGFPVATMIIESIWEPDFETEAEKVYQSKSLNHHGVNYLFNCSNKVYVGGRLKKINLPVYYDFKHYRLSPYDVKNQILLKGWKRIIAFQTRNPMHRAHYEITKKAMENISGNLLLHPVIGQTQLGDINYSIRVRCYEHIYKKYPKKSTMLALLPLAMRMAGPREALFHALIRKNYGCTHIIIGRDHAGATDGTTGKSFYDPYDAQELVKEYEKKIGIQMIPFQHMVYVPNIKQYKPFDEIKNESFETLSGTKLRSLLDKGEKIPDWFSFPEIIKELQKANPPLHKQGFTVFFTGLSGSGKSTLANGLLIRLMSNGERPVTLLDGDIVRTHLSSELGFSKEHRSINVKRIGFVASEITKNGGVAICAPIAPYNHDRGFNKALISKFGGYIEVFVDTPIEECESRDVKGLYKLAREGKIKKFTGISDPYEKPLFPDITVNSDGSLATNELVEKIYNLIVDKGFIHSKSKRNK